MVGSPGERLTLPGFFMVVRTPWSNFPPVAVHTDGQTLKSHPDYLAAKNGDLKAARRVVSDTFKPGKIAGLVQAAKSSIDYVVPVQQLDPEARWNALPLAFAKAAARELGARVVPFVVQDNIVSHTSADSATRLTNQPSFSGTVPKGKFLIVDDVVTLGSTLANLRGYIEHKGGQVVMASSIISGIFATRIAPDPGLVSSIKRRFPNELGIFPEKLGFPVDCLTNREGNFVYGLANLESIRNPLVPTHNSIRPTV
jgi:hypothetical protein